MKELADRGVSTELMRSTRDILDDAKRSFNRPILDERPVL
jgi:hypothetical protein